MNCDSLTAKLHCVSTLTLGLGCYLRAFRLGQNSFKHWSECTMLDPSHIFLHQYEYRGCIQQPLTAVTFSVEPETQCKL